MIPCYSASHREENEEAEHEYEEIDEDPHSNDLVSVNENNANISQLTGALKTTCSQQLPVAHSETLE